MAQAELTPVEDSVAKVNDEVAVGEDLEFQQKWWRFEHFVWGLFVVLLLCDLSGLFGRGPLAKAERHTADGTISLKYERIERTGTPSFLAVEFGPNAIHNGEVQLFVSQSLVKELGAQRVAPAPLRTTIGNGGLTYTFPATATPATVQFSLEPSAPGLEHFTMYVPGAESLTHRVVIMP